MGVHFLFLIFGAAMLKALWPPLAVPPGFGGLISYRSGDHGCLSLGRLLPGAQTSAQLPSDAIALGAITCQYVASCFCQEKHLMTSALILHALHQPIKDST